IAADATIADTGKTSSPPAARRKATTIPASKSVPAESISCRYRQERIAHAAPGLNKGGTGGRIDFSPQRINRRVNDIAGRLDVLVIDVGFDFGAGNHLPLT